MYEQLFDNQEEVTSKLNKARETLEKHTADHELLAKIKDQVDNCVTRLEETELERDYLRRELNTLRETVSRETTAEASHRPRSRSRSRTKEQKLMKTYKFADPSVFSDGNGTDMKFRSWRTAIKTKLRANADHFPTPELRKANRKKENSWLNQSRLEEGVTTLIHRHQVIISLQLAILTQECAETGLIVAKAILHRGELAKNRMRVRTT